MRKYVTLGAAVAMAAVLSGCGSARSLSASPPATSEQPTSSATRAPSEAPQDGNTEAYVAALASTSSAEARQASKVSAAGTPAYDYAMFNYYFVLATEEADGRTYPHKVEHVGDEWKICFKSQPDSCTTFTDVVLTSQDMVSDFKIDGKPIAGRILGSDNKSYPVGGVASATVEASYRSASRGKTYVVIRIHNGDTPTVLANDMAYRSPNGSQLEAEAVDAPETLLPGATAHVLFQFPDVALGGQVYLHMFTTTGPVKDGSVMMATK
jgi:hypothetical protein